MSRATALGLLVLLALSCRSYPPTFSPDDIDPGVTLGETKRAIEMAPVHQNAGDVGLLFYPGGLVDAHVYDEILGAFSSRTGIRVVVVKMPFDLAVFAKNSGLKVIADYPEIGRWVIGGHSLGGAMAASSVKDNRDVYQGLILMDSYPPDGDSLKDWDGSVLSLFSSVEKVSDPERMEKTLSLIPPATWLTGENREYPAAHSNYSVIHRIDGGSHSYFGTYGPQRGDVPPTISREAFHGEVIDFMTQYFEENNWL